MRHSRKLGAAQQRWFTMLLGGPAGIELLLPGVAGPLVRRRSPRSKRFAWYARSTVDGKTVERFVADENDLSPAQVAAMRAVAGTVRRRATSVDRLTKAGFPVPPAHIVAMLEALAPALDELVLVDDWAPLVFEGLTGHRGCAFEEPLVYPPLSFVLCAGQSVEDIVELLELGGGDWLATPQDLRGVTRITGPLGAVILYDREIGAPASRIAGIAGTGVMLTGSGLNVKVLSPLDQVFWDAWRASKNGADAGLRRARAAALAPWAAVVDPCCRTALCWWADFVPGIVRATVRSFAKPTQILLAALRLPVSPACDPERALPTEAQAIPQDPSPKRVRPLCIEWRAREHAAYAAFKLELEPVRDRLTASRVRLQTALGKAKAAKTVDVGNVADIERELAERERDERSCTRLLSKKRAELDAIALAAMRKSNAKASRALRPERSAVRDEVAIPV